MMVKVKTRLCRSVTRSKPNRGTGFFGKILYSLVHCGFVIFGLTVGAAAQPLEFDLIEREIVSLREDGRQISNFAGNPSISQDGRRIAFTSTDAQIVKGSSPFQDIYVRDSDLNLTFLVSGADKGLANGSSYQPSISQDGDFVAFASQASNLYCAACDANSTMDVFLFDIGKRRIQRISQTPKDANGPSYQPSVSRDGNRVAFTSWAGNLVGNDTNEKRDIFVWDRFKGLKRISYSPQGDQFPNGSHSPQISADGRWVVFVTEAPFGQSQIYVRDLDDNATFRVSAEADLTLFGRNQEPSISETGDMIAWVSNGYDGRGDGAPYRVFVRQMTTSTVCLPICIVTNPNTGQLNRLPGEQRQPQIFGWAGRFAPPVSLAGPLFGVVYTSTTKEGRRDVILDYNEVFDPPGDYIWTLSKGEFGDDANGNSQNPTVWGPVGGLGWYVAFETDANNLVVDANTVRDIVRINIR